MKTPTPPKLRTFPAAKQRRMDQLLDKNSEGTITDTERAVLAKLVAEAEALMVENAKRLASFSKAERADHSPSAVPVTVWVQPQRHNSEP